MSLKYLALAALLGAGIWYFLLRPEPVERQAIAQVVESPQAQFQALLSSQSVEATKLAALCSEYPQLAPQYLRNQEFLLRGVIEDFQLSGIDGRRAEVTLHSGNKQNVIVVFDLDRYSRLAVSERTAGHYTIVDTELLWVNRDGENKRRIFLKETPISQQVITRSVGTTNITFLTLDSPRGN